MYRLEKKARDHDRFLSPSFSSSLLDQIYRSIDDGDTKNDEAKFYRDIKTTVNKKQWTEQTDRKDDDKTNNKIRRSEKVAVETEMDQDVLFFSSTSISSDSSFGGFSSSDTESLYGTRSSRPSSTCMPKPPKPVRTSASFRLDQRPVTRMFDDDDGFCRNSKTKQGTAVVRDEEALLIKNKSRALKIYNNLKKVKQPISPGGRLTSFLNSLFASGNAKKKKSSSNNNKKGTCEDVNQASTYCSSARSCLSKTKTTSSSSERNRLCNEVKLNKTVRFYPEEEEAARDFWKEYRTHNQKKNDLVVLKDLKMNHYEEDGDDAASCASSDLFELDHLAVLGSARYCEELPVYETTHVSTNRAIANGLIV